MAPSTSPRPTITVTGSSSLSHPAERAIATLVVSDKSTSQEAVAQNVRKVSASLRALLTSLAPKNTTSSSAPSADAPITHWSNSSLSTSWTLERLNNESTETERKYTARMTYEVWFHDFERLGEVSAILSTMEHLMIQRISWCLTDATSERLADEGRGNAVRDAVRRASGYAKALRGADVVDGEEAEGSTWGVRVVEVIDQARGADQVRKFKAMVGTGGREVLEFTPEDVSISIHAAVKFEIV